MGKKSKKDKSSKKKDHKKKKHKSSKKKDRSSDESSTSTDSSRSSSPSNTRNKPELSVKTNKETLDEFFNKSGTNASWHLAQKSETLMFDHFKESEDKTTETFIWRKKNQKTDMDKLDPQNLIMLNKLKQEETQRELEKLKRRKIERERERDEREREREFLQRQKETEYHKEWEKQEDSFHLKQVKLRSKIRIEEARAKPIDLLAKYINAEEDDLAIEMHEPYTYLNGLTIKDLEDLIVDIKVYSDLELGINAEYWRDITIVTEDELKKLQKLDKNSREHVGDRREGISQAVLQDVTGLFKGKTYEQLIQLEDSIKKKIQFETGIDIGYWESLLAQLKAHMARARLRDRHQKVLNDKLISLKKEQGIEDKNEDHFEKKIQERIRKEEEAYKNKQRELSTSKSGKNNSDQYDSSDDENLDDSNIVNQITISINEYESGNYSPILISQDDLPFDTFIITQEEDNQRLELKRSQILGEGYIKPSVEDEFEKNAKNISLFDQLEGNDGETKTTARSSGGASNEIEASSKSQEQNGESNTQEVALEHQYFWSDKYRPRKPRYYNRVHTGYDWNQYNKKHYDGDNPPPKIVQGYKFNIFYPDMIDKTKTPTYSMTTCKDNKDFSVLRFHAGPPYEDIAFKIVSKEWDTSQRHGFRNQFQNGIYQLWFHFRKWKYRR